MPMQVTGPRAGPKMPPPAKPDADSQWSPLFSAEAGQKLTQFRLKHIIQPIEDDSFDNSQDIFKTPTKRKRPDELPKDRH